METRPAWGTAPIKCGNHKCDWTGTERDLIHHPEDEGKFCVRSVCPKCHCDDYTFPRRKRVHSQPNTITGPARGAVGDVLPHRR